MDTNIFLNKLNKNNHHLSTNFPTKVLTQSFVDQLANMLFPFNMEIYSSIQELKTQWNNIQQLFKELLKPLESSLSYSINEISDLYFEDITTIYDDLLLDANTILEFDPAAHSIEEVILAYPGFRAIMVYRITHPLFNLNIPILPRLFSEYAHSQTGIDIHPGAQIGKSFFIDHGTGIVIGETTVIGNNVKIYQGVTLGALSVRKDKAKTKRHPTIEDNVIIYSGSTILGGDTTIGHDSIIGGNVWLTESIEPYSVVYHKSEIHIRNKSKNRVEQINFSI